MQSLFFEKMNNIKPLDKAQGVPNKGKERVQRNMRAKGVQPPLKFYIAKL
jgi:hypothetical protein